MHLKLRVKLVEALIQQNCELQSRPQKGRLPDNSLSSLMERHFPNYLLPTEKKMHRVHEINKYSQKKKDMVSSHVEIT